MSDVLFIVHGSNANAYEWVRALAGAKASRAVSLWQDVHRMLHRLAADGDGAAGDVFIPDAALLKRRVRLLAGLSDADSRYATQLIIAAEALTVGVDSDFMSELAQREIKRTGVDSPLVVYDIRTLDDLDKLRRLAPRALVAIVAERSDPALLCDSVETSMFESAFEDLLGKAGGALFDLQLSGKPTQERVDAVLERIAELRRAP